MSYRYILSIAGMVGAVLGGLMLYAALQHNPQGEFFDTVTGEIELLRCLAVFGSWCLLGFAVIALAGALLIGLNRRRWKFMLLLAAVLAGMGIWGLRILDAPGFDPAAWRDADRMKAGYRLTVVDGLLRRHSFTGISRAELVALLGEPEKPGYFKEYQLVYWLGPERGMISVDSEWLAFKLDAAGKVSEYRVMKD